MQCQLTNLDFVKNFAHNKPKKGKGNAANRHTGPVSVMLFTITKDTERSYPETHVLLNICIIK